MCRDPVVGKLPPGKVREVLLAVSTVLSHLVGVRIEDCDWNWELELVPGPHSDLQQRKHKNIKIRSSNMQICSVKHTFWTTKHTSLNTIIIIQKGSHILYRKCVWNDG